MKCLRHLRALFLSIPACLGLAACAAAQTPAVFVPAAKSIDHTNFDPGGLSTSKLHAAANLKVYFEHASVGGNIFSDSSNGFDTLRSQDVRYSSDRVKWNGTANPSWFDAHAGLADNYRGNPGAQKKIDHFRTALTSGLGAKLDVASFKFCWIDTPSDAEALFASARRTTEALEQRYPTVVFVWWTMPLERDQARAERQRYNNLVRDYCASNNRWLLDIAALESHDDAGNLVADAHGQELQYGGYSSDGGHLNTAGAVKMAKAYWQLIAGIAMTR